MQEIFSGVVYHCKENDTRGTDPNHTGPQALRTYRTLFGTYHAHSSDTEERRECEEVCVCPKSQGLSLLEEESIGTSGRSLKAFHTHERSLWRREVHDPAALH